MRPIVGGQTTLENEYHENTEEQSQSKVFSVAQDHLDTFNNAVERFMTIFSHFCGEHKVLTLDQALHCRLIQLKWCVPEYQNRLAPRLGITKAALVL